MSRACIIALAARHRIDADELIEAWEERAAIREYLGGFTRRAVELWAVGDVEAMFRIGLHCDETRARWVAGGERMQPGKVAMLSSYEFTCQRNVSLLE